MKLRDLGINPKTGCHDKRLTPAESRFLGILWTDHMGQKRRISAHDLAKAFDKSEESGQAKRNVRYLQNHLLMHHDHIPVLSKAGSGGGYWIAETQAEATEFYDTFRKRGLTGVVKATRGRQAALVDMVQQLSFELEDLVDRTGFQRRARLRNDQVAPVQVVDAFLAKMLKEPEKFADWLQKIGAKYGSVLLPKEQLAAIQAKVLELQKVAAGLGV